MSKMQRKTIGLLCNSMFKRVSSLSVINRCPPCAHLHLSRHWCNGKITTQKVASVESMSDFSKYDADQFGTLNPKTDISDKLDEMPEEEDDKVEFLIQDTTGRKVRRNMIYYHNLIKKFIREKKIADAIDVLEERMLKRDKVKPDYYIYNLLINGCASVGYTKKAFKLYNKMKQAGIKTTAATYTGLLNACANSLMSDDALIHINNLRKQFEEKGIMLNNINYNAMIKAYARLKDVKSAFLVVDEMMAKKLVVDEASFVFLFQACVSDKEAGFRHALILWHKMRRRSIKPNTYIFNQFLRCVRDCGIGDVKETIESVKLIAERANKYRMSSDNKIVRNPLAISASSNLENLSEDIETNDISLLEKKENRPNLLAPIPHLGSIVHLKDVNTSTDRLLLLGGFRNVLEEMKSYACEPDIKTFTILLDIIPSTLVAEEALMKELKNFIVNIDIDFCNMLIKKRAYRRDYDNGRAVLEIIQANYLSPDIVTFGVLALCCKTAPEARQLIHDMRQFGFRLNVEIIGGMLKQACYGYNYEYVQYLLKLMKRLEIQPTEKIIENVQFLMKKSAEHFNIKKNHQKSKIGSDINPFNFERYRMFRDYYKQWRKEITLYKPPHPYKQFCVRFEPQNEEEEELLELEKESQSKINNKNSPYAEAPVKGPAKWHKPKPKILDLTESEERRRYLKGFKNQQFIDDGSFENRNAEIIMKFQPVSEDKSEKHQENSHEGTKKSDEVKNKIVWKRVDDSVPNQSQSFVQDEEILEEPT